MDYAKIYEYLYKVGYHAKEKNHGKQYVKFICDNYKFNSILDVGCSNGIAVRDFRLYGKRLAMGIDASEIAVRYANEKYLARQCITGLANDIPFKDNFFDAVFSCDVLEHLTPDDALIAVKELCRVAKNYLFLVIDGELERNREFIDKAKIQFPKVFKEVNNLHLTLWPLEKWIQLFREEGFDLIKKERQLIVMEK